MMAATAVYLLTASMASTSVRPADGNCKPDCKTSIAPTANHQCFGVTGILGYPITNEGTYLDLLRRDGQKQSPPENFDEEQCRQWAEGCIGGAAAFAYAANFDGTGAKSCAILGDGGAPNCPKLGAGWVRHNGHAGKGAPHARGPVTHSNGDHRWVSYSAVVFLPNSKSCSMPVTEAPSSSVLTGDPFILDPAAGRRVHFFIPLKKDELLLKCYNNWRLYGSAIGSGISGDHEQWFERVRITVGDDEVLNVRLAPNSTNSTPATPAPTTAAEAKQHPGTLNAHLRSLQVDVEGKPMTKAGARATESMSLIAVFKGGKGRYGHETVQFTHDAITLQIKHAIAEKFNDTEEDDLDDDKPKLVPHIELHFVEIEAPNCNEGILAEIWGLTTMTQRTAAMLEPPTPNPATEAKPAQTTTKEEKPEDIPKQTQ